MPYEMILAAVAAMQAPVATVHAGADHAASPTATATAVTPLRRDAKGRPVIAVRINDRGPFDMVVDTAAQTGLVTIALAEELALPKLRAGATVQGATERTETPLFGVDHLSNALFDVRDAAMPALLGTGITDARGIVGMDVAAGRKLTFDAQAGTLRLDASAPAANGFVAVKGRLDASGLLVVPVVINGRTVDALVDTGATGVVAGADLVELLGWTATDPRLKPYGTMRGAGGGGRAVRVATMDAIQIGPARFSNVPVVITAPEAGGRESPPQVILGTDLLNLLPAYAVDFGRAELHIRVPTAERR